MLKRTATVIGHNNPYLWNVLQCYTFVIILAQRHEMMSQCWRTLFITAALTLMPLWHVGWQIHWNRKIHLSAEFFGFVEQFMNEDCAEESLFASGDSCPLAWKAEDLKSFRFFKITTLCFVYCFAHSWHSLGELHEVVTWNDFPTVDGMAWRYTCGNHPGSVCLQFLINPQHCSQHHHTTTYELHGRNHACRDHTLTFSALRKDVRVLFCFCFFQIFVIKGNFWGW